MAASSPGDDNKKSLSSDRNSLVTNDSTNNQGKEDIKLVKEDTDSHPIDEDVNTEKHSHSKMNFHDLLKKHLYADGERIVVSANQTEFQSIFSCFHNYEKQLKKDPSFIDKALKLLNVTDDEMFRKDFLFYLLLAYRFTYHRWVYGHLVESYVTGCINKFEAITEVQAMTTLSAFIQMGDFQVTFEHVNVLDSGFRNDDVSVFCLFYHMTNSMFKRSTRSNEKAGKFIYHKILWIALRVFFGSQIYEEPSTLAALWKSYLLNEKVQKKLKFSKEVLDEFLKGFELLKALRLPDGVCFDYVRLAEFLDPSVIKTLHISYITDLMEACEICFSQSAKQLQEFLKEIRYNYNKVFEDWARYSLECTKSMAYEEAIEFLEYIFGCISELNDGESSKKAVIETEIMEWMKLLVNSVNILSDDAVKYFEKLQAKQAIAGFSKKYTAIVTNLIHDRGMEYAKQFAVPQFYKLFTGLNIWKFQFVEKFLNYFFMAKTVSLKDASWKLLLKEISDKFSDARCKRCIVGLIKRISKAYAVNKRQNTFVTDLMQLDVPNLFLTQSFKEDDQSIEIVFIGMICEFIQENTLKEVILSQVIDIMGLVKSDNHLQSLILTAIQKEIIPDHSMLEKLNSSNHLTNVINASLNAACISLNTLSKLSESDKFYWHFISSCCRLIQPNTEDLSKLSKYLFAIDKLGKIFQQYCATRNISKSSTYEVSQEIKSIPNVDVNDYFTWVHKMQNIMVKWQQKTFDEEFNYDDIVTYDSNLLIMVDIARSVNVEHLVISPTEIAVLKNRYSEAYANLSSILIKGNKEYGWCLFVELLNCYGVKLSNTLRSKLDNHLVILRKDSVTNTNDLQQVISESNSQLEQESKIHVRLYKSMTLEILVSVVEDLQLFLKPILDQIEFLVYFHLHDCTMFSRHLKSQIVEVSAHSEQTGEVPAMTLGLPAVSTKQTSSDADKKLLQFSTALQKTKEFILSMIRGTAKYEDIFFEDSSEESVLKFDAETEFKILCGFPEFKSNEEGKEGIKHMLELVQYSPQISKIPDVCSQYHLDNCLDDPKMKELKEIINSVETAKNRAKITGKIANNYMKRIRETLNFSDSSVAKKCLRIFPVVANCPQFYQFIKKKEFINNRDAFSSQVELITAQLQHGNYDETVLNHLTPAFKYISPFLDTKQSLSELMDKISKLCSEGVGFGCDPTKHFCQLETVNSNITMIQLWFSRAEGDTLENVSKELKWIMEHGYFKFIIRPKIDCGESDVNHSKVFLHFKPQISSCVSEKWNNEQIDDFVRKLGFLESQSPDVDQKVKTFQQLSQIAQKYYHILVKLRDLGHSEHVEKEETISCSAEIESAESKEADYSGGSKNFLPVVDSRHSAELSTTEKVANAEKKLENWKSTIRDMYKKYDELLFCSIPKILSLHKTLVASDASTDKVVHEIGFLFKNDPETTRMLTTAVETATSTVEATPSQTPFAIVGKFLAWLCNHSLITNHFLFSRSHLSKRTSFKETIHFAPNYDNGQLLRLLIEIYNGVPESYEVFQCDNTSTEEDLKLFLSRASKFRSQTFTILGINMLPYELQEVILQHHSEEQTMESTICLHYVETACSILHEMPWIEVKEHKENGPDLKWDNAKRICKSYVNKGNANFDLALVYGCAGNGKTHYIKKQLYGLQPYLIIAVNESFTPLNAILKLRSLPRDKCCKIYFNFTIVESTVDKKLMNTLAWFFFKLLIFEYLEDLETGITFRLPGGYRWRIFVEVPSLHEDAQDNLDWIYKEVPIFKLLAKSVLIDKERPYDIDPSVQLVCKYLNAYEKRTDEKKGINKLFTSGQEVNFGNDPNISYDQCHILLKKFMPADIADNKVLQHLFIKYMERRCKFMQNYPGFCYNTGAGVIFNHKQVNENELKKMVDNKRLVKSKDTYYSNARRLGELLMETMLQEVHEFCKIDIQQNWGAHAHQQLIYEVKHGGGTIQLLTLKPDEISPERTMKFVEVIRVEIPTMTQLLRREKLDSYLSAALGVPLKNGRLQDIDDAKYVLTLDYTVKMLSIHERRECGVPVIIKGETGVGKTALINMLSRLWNHALISEWRAVKGKIIDMLYKKSSELPNSNLRATLKQLYDSELNTTDRYLTEEELLPLMELHQNSDATPYFKFVNKNLLQMRDNDSILELLDVNDETKGSVTGHHRRWSNFSDEGNSIVNLISNCIETSSAQATTKLLCVLLKGKLISTFYKLNIHAALSPKEIQEFFMPIIKMAKHLMKIHKERQQQQAASEPPVVTVFLDEVNTSSCMGLFKEIIIDRSFDGEPLPPNIFLVAACNPHRGNSSVFHEDKKEEAWIRGSYYVQKLHPTMRFVMWDYGSLNDEQELAYVRAKMIMANKHFNIAKNVELSELIVECQKLMREYAYEQLRRFGLKDSEAKPCAASCVSQRDIQRVFTFYEWISKTYDMMQKSTTAGTQHPIISKKLSPEEIRHCALLVALGLVYYMRLNSEYRKSFTHKLDKRNFAVKFLTAFTQEMDFYADELSLPTGIAKTEALKENLFATIVCTVTKTPLIIVGAPGSSKTLSFNLSISNLKGPESKQKLFRNTEVFKSLDPQYYQCSRRTTSTEIETVFQRAINRQRSHESFSLPIRCVVFMDEAGLPEESHESLKVLHYHLDQQEVAFVAITNHILDAAKTNRAVSLFRPTASQRDLETLAKGCLWSTPKEPPPEIKRSLETIVKFCSAYSTIMRDKCVERFFGLRDFIHFINYIRRKGKSNITAELVLESLERNFNGTEEFEEICKVFLKEMGAKLDRKEQRNIIAILRSSLEDKQLPSTDDTQNEVRYKLIIDPSEDESITRLLFMFGILKRKNTRTYVCSDFLGDGQLQKINTIAAIRHSAVAGHTVIMSQTDDIHESFYDLFNLNFRKIYDPEAGSTRYFTNIAIGAHLKPSKVNLEFQCIVVVKESEIKNTPAAFLNRFEKYFISHENLLNLVFDKLPPCLREIANVVYEKVQKFYSLLEPDSFYGGNKATVCSLMLSILPRPDHQYKPPKSFVTSGSSSNKVLLLQNIVKYLHELGGFYFTESSVEELEHDANCIISLLATTRSDFSGVVGVMKNLKSCDAAVMFQWINESLSLIYTEKEEEDIRASDGACMVTAMIAQWILRFLCKKLIQLMTPEAAILKRKCIPISYFETYLNYQTHFSIKELIKKHTKVLSQCNDEKVATKLICYTRSTSSIHQLPAVFPRTSFYSPEELQQSKNCIENLIYEKADDLFLCKLSSISSQAAFKSQLQAFETSQQQTIFVLVINMKETSQQIINHIRIMIEEVECTTRKIKKLYVLLLHFPAMMFYDPCYPSLFLCGWDHHYLDTIDQTDHGSLVDIREWFRQSCLTSKELTTQTEADDLMLQSLLHLLSEPESILIIASRILLNVDSNELSLDSSSDIAVKAHYLNKLLFDYDKKVAKTLCLKFKSYWKPSVMGDHLEEAAKFSKSRESTLNVSDYVDSVYRSTFFNFIVYMIYQISKNCSLDILLKANCESAMFNLFLKLLDAYSIPKLAEIKAFNNTWDCRVHATSRTGYMPQFPFFMKVSAQICNIVKRSMADINNNFNILQENGGSLSVGSCDPLNKQQMLEKLYEHSCAVTTKEKQIVEEEHLSVTAVKEMGSDEMMWQKYCSDFIHYYLHLHAAPDSLEHRVLLLTLTRTLTNFTEMKPVAVHCYLHIFSLDLAKVVASLKSIRQLQVLELDQQLLCQKDAENSLFTALQASKPTLDGSSISNFIKSISIFLIDLLFKVLISNITCKDNRLASLKNWFIAYRDMMSLSSVKSTLAITAVDLSEQLKAQYHLMEVTFLTLLYFHDVALDAVECACSLACHLQAEFFSDELKFKGSRPLNLKQIVIALNLMLQNSQFTKLISVPQFYQYIMEGLFTHFFPDTNDPTCVYGKEDVEFFLMFANDQSTLEDVTETICPVDRYKNVLCFSKLKFYLDRILCKGWSKNEIYAKPTNFYKLETCICVGKTILSQCQGVALSEYIPLYLQQAAKKNQNNLLMKQKLIHLYFNTVLEKLQTRQFTPSRLLTMIAETEQKSTEIISSDAVKLVAIIEKQALLEVLLQAVANSLESRNDFQNLLSMSDQLNSWIKDESHHDILLMHLMKRYHGLKNVLALLDKKSREPLNCLKSINEKLKASPPSASHQFPFVTSNPTAKCDFTKMYREICTHLQNVTGGSSKKFLHYVNSIIKGNHKRKSTVHMMIWLCVYYEFYCAKKTSPELVDFFNQAQEDLGLSKEHLNILSCFLHPSNMIKEEEIQNPVNLNAEVFEYTKEGNIVPKKPPSDVPKRDPIWEFFNPDEDPCDIELRHALANMVAVVFGIPGKSTHLWYHMFSPKDLENSYMTGFMYPSMVKNGGLMYDCGCELSEDGNYGRSDYDTIRGTLSLHSWYLLLWCNFGAFCIGLLTQPTALEQIKGHVLSDWMSIRHYCMAQLNTVWLHIRTNMSLGDEERSFFIMRSMHQLFMLFQEDAFPHPQGVFVHPNELNEYEKTWHEHIYKPSKLNLKHELKNHSSNSVWALPVLKTFRMLELHYPRPATKNDYMKSLIDTTEANDCSSTHLLVLHQFVREEKKLQKGGALLPDLVEFYQWIHTELSYLVTYQRAEEISIGKIINLSSRRYSQDYFEHLTGLFKGIKRKYNDYLRVNGGNVGIATCNRAAKPTDVHYIDEDTRLIKLLSLEDTDENDWLYIVLMDVIENHNTFLRRIFTHAETLGCHYKKYLPDKLPELLITEVTEQSCIVPSIGADKDPCNGTDEHPSHGTDENPFLKLINSHYIYNDIYSIAKFDLNQLEQDVVKIYIAGKPLIVFDSNIRTVFRFKNLIPGSKEGYAIDLSAIAQELPEEYKEQLNDGTSKRLEVGFHAASYHMFTEIVDGLRIVMRDLVQHKGLDPTLNIKLVDYLRKLFDKDHQLFNEIGIKSISDAQRKLLGDVEMKRLFHCLELFVDWLQSGLYDFRSLPILVFDHLDVGDVDSIMEIHTKYLPAEMNCLLNQLDEFEKLLNQAENHLTRKEDLKSSIIQVLNDLGLCDYSEKLVGLIPKTILACHYVHFRMTFRKLKITVTTMTHSQPQKLPVVTDQWTEIIDLWMHLPYFHNLYDEKCLKFDCVKLQYGDQEESHNDSETWPHQNILDKEDAPEEVDEVKEKATILQKFEENPELRKAVLLSLASNPTADSISQPIPAQPIPIQPNVKGEDMTTEQLCQWLRTKKVAEKYIKCFENEDIDGSVLAAYKDEHLISLGISEEHVRIKILKQFKKLL